MSDTPKVGPCICSADVDGRPRHQCYYNDKGPICENKVDTAVTSDTPRTDKARWDAGPGEMVVNESFAQELERDLASARAEADDLRQKLALATGERDKIAGLNHEQWLELQYLRGVFEAAHALNAESEEHDFPDGMGRGAGQSYWDKLDTALEVENKTDAIIEVLGWKQSAETAEAKLREWAREAHEDVEDWGACASEYYFQEKWSLADDLAKWRRRAEGGE